MNLFLICGNTFIEMEYNSQGCFNIHVLLPNPLLQNGHLQRIQPWQKLDEGVTDNHIVIKFNKLIKIIPIFLNKFLIIFFNILLSCTLCIARGHALVMCIRERIETMKDVHFVMSILFSLRLSFLSLNLYSFSSTIVGLISLLYLYFLPTYTLEVDIFLFLLFNKTTLAS